MKWLVCDHCKAPAYGGASARFPDGEPLVFGRITRFPFMFKCSKCKKLTSVSGPQWNKLENLTEEEISKLGIVA